MTSLYFAPMEGVTGYVYRSAHHEFFNHVDKYYTPFISPNQKLELSHRDQVEVLPEHNKGIRLIPQILTNRADYFIQTARALKEFGYDEVNLNLGCPSRTVVSKGKGAGFLARREELTSFLEEIYTKLDMRVSVKTRIGMKAPEEFYGLMELFNRFPMEELIIHPRLQQDYYNNTPDMEMFREAVRLSKNPLCYNGDLFTAEDYRSFTKDFPEIPAVMLGRGLIANPGLAGELRGGACMDRQVFLHFHERLIEGYRETISGDRNVLFRMKELWLYMGHMFPDSDKYLKKIRKAAHLDAYLETVAQLLEDRQLQTVAGYAPEGRNTKMSARATKKAVLVVSFGTSYSGTLKKTIEEVEADIGSAFPDCEIRRAFSSPTIRRILERKEGMKIDSPKEALARLKREAFESVIVQPTYIMSGFEYDGTAGAAEEFRDFFPSFALGVPLLAEEADYKALADILIEETGAYSGKETAIVFMGHGTEHEANESYRRLELHLKAAGGSNYYVGTVEAEPGISEVVEKIRKTNTNKVVLLPLMTVAGDHANNDMAGAGKDSWKSVLEDAGYEVECVLKGLGEYERVRKMFVEHTLAARGNMTRLATKTLV